MVVGNSCLGLVVIELEEEHIGVVAGLAHRLEELWRWRLAQSRCV